MYYIINQDPETRYEDFDTILEYCIPDESFSDDYEAFDEYLDQDGEIEVCGRYYYPSYILREIDNSAYEDEMCSWAENAVENAREEGMYDLRNLAVGAYTYINGERVDCFEDEPEENEEENTSEELLEELEIKINLQLTEERKESKEQEDRLDEFKNLFMTIK